MLLGVLLLTVVVAHSLFVIREKAFREMKNDVGMTTAQKSKETRRMEMGSIFVLYIQPTIPTYTYIITLATRRCSDHYSYKYSSIFRSDPDLPALSEVWNLSHSTEWRVCECRDIQYTAGHHQGPQSRGKEG